MILQDKTAANRTYPQWLDFLSFTFGFHEQNFILAERTLLAFPPLRVAAKRQAVKKPLFSIHFTCWHGTIFVLSGITFQLVFRVPKMINAKNSFK